jgi:sec-independent protein translocase protein TatA
MFNLGTPEIILLLVIGVVLFGRRLPEIGRSMGKGIVEFKKGLSGLEDEIEGSSDRQEAMVRPNSSNAAGGAVAP